MYRIFCCRSQSRRRDVVDDMTDSIENCLTLEEGQTAFRSFLVNNKFTEESRTLSFYFLCDTILTRISNLSPATIRNETLPTGIENDIQRLITAAGGISFDLQQMNQIERLSQTQIPPLSVREKAHIIGLGKCWSLDLLRNIYRTFRQQTLAAV